MIRENNRVDEGKMKINELEKQLGIKRANIFFYEKEGLLHPERSENNYREYSLEDIEQLKQIIVFRKLGFSLSEIRRMLNGNADLSETIPENMARLQQQLDQLSGAMELCKQMQEQHLSMVNFNANDYLGEISKKEKSGRHFMNLRSDTTKKKLILMTGNLDRIVSKSTRSSNVNRMGVDTGTNKDVVNNWSEELENMSSEQLTREVRTSLILAVPIVLLLVLCIGGAIFFIFHNRNQEVQYQESYSQEQEQIASDCIRSSRICDQSGWHRCRDRYL